MIPPSLERDLIGYGGKPPNPRWPGAAALALNFVLNYEEGSEYSMTDRDGVTDAALTELPARACPGRPGPCRGKHVRIRQPRRLLAPDRLFHERDLPMTVYACALALERNPPRPRRSGRPATTSAATAGAGSNILSSTKRPSASTSASPSKASRRRRPAAARLVLPLRAEREHAPPRDRGRRLPL